MGRTPAVSAGHFRIDYHDCRSRGRPLARLRRWIGRRDLFFDQYYHHRNRQTRRAGGPVYIVDRNRLSVVDDRLAPGSRPLATLAFAGAVSRAGYADQRSDSPDLLLRRLFCRFSSSARDTRSLRHPAHFLSLLLILGALLCWAIPCSLAVSSHNPVRGLAFLVDRTRFTRVCGVERTFSSLELVAKRPTDSEEFSALDPAAASFMAEGDGGAACGFG